MIEQGVERPNLPCGKPQGLSNQLGDLTHQLIVRPVDPIPLQHHEFGIVPAAMLAGSKHLTQLEDIAGP